MQKKTPIWPLYAADALMFVSVFLMALPNITRGDSIEPWQAFTMAGLVFVAMLLLIVPYLIDYFAQIRLAKIEMLRINTQGEEQVRIIFSDLRTLKNAILEQAESLQNISKLSSATAQDLFAEKARVKKLTENFTILQTFEKECRTKIEELENIEDPQAKKDELEEFYERVENLENAMQKIRESLSEISLQLKASEIQGANLSKIADENLEKKFDSPNEFESTEVEEKAQNDEFKKVPQPNWSGMIEKALSNSQANSTRQAVSRFIEKNKAGDAPNEEDESDFPLEQKLSPQEKIKDISESLTPEEIENSESYAQVEEGVEAYEQKTAKNAFENSTEQPTLFGDEEIPEVKKPRHARSGDTAIIVNAFIGIGNCPFVRGYGNGLDPNKGVPMQMLEIGKWQWKCDGLPSEALHISIWLNDETPSQMGEIMLNLGETLEVDLSF